MSGPILGTLPNKGDRVLASLSISVPYKDTGSLPYRIIYYSSYYLLLDKVPSLGNNGHPDAEQDSRGEAEHHQVDVLVKVRVGSDVDARADDAGAAGQRDDQDRAVSSVQPLEELGYPQVVALVAFHDRWRVHWVVVDRVNCFELIAVNQKTKKSLAEII